MAILSVGELPHTSGYWVRWTMQRETLGEKPARPRVSAGLLLLPSTAFRWPPREPEQYLVGHILAPRAHSLLHPASLKKPDFCGTDRAAGIYVFLCVLQVCRSGGSPGLRRLRRSCQSREKDRVDTSKSHLD